MDDRVEGQCTRQRDEIPEQSAATRIGYLQDGLFGWSVTRVSSRIRLLCSTGCSAPCPPPPPRGRGVSTPSRAELDAARLLLQRMGISPADLLKAPAPRRVVPTFADYLPVVAATVSCGTRVRLVLEPGHAALGQPAHRRPGRSSTAIAEWIGDIRDTTALALASLRTGSRRGSHPRRAAEFLVSAASSSTS
jgi:hypothetical protein